MNAAHEQDTARDPARDDPWLIRNTVLLAEGVRACANTPLYAHGELVGSLNLGLADPGPLTPEIQSIVKEHGGRIEVECRAGQSSVFRVWLPAVR